MPLWQSAKLTCNSAKGSINERDHPTTNPSDQTMQQGSSDATAEGYGEDGEGGEGSIPPGGRGGGSGGHDPPRMTSASPDDNLFYCLRWNGFNEHLMEGCENLFISEDFADCTLACEGHILKAHKIILAMSSSYFREIFLENPCKHPVIIIKGMNFEDFHNVIQFIYYGRVNVHKENIEDFVAAAESLKIEGLIRHKRSGSGGGGGSYVPNSAGDDYFPRGGWSGGGGGGYDNEIKSEHDSDDITDSGPLNLMHGRRRGEDTDEDYRSEERTRSLSTSNLPTTSSANSTNNPGPHHTPPPPQSTPMDRPTAATITPTSRSHPVIVDSSSLRDPYESWNGVPERSEGPSEYAKVRQSTHSRPSSLSPPNRPDKSPPISPIASAKLNAIGEPLPPPLPHCSSSTSTSSAQLYNGPSVCGSSSMAHMYIPPHSSISGIATTATNSHIMRNSFSSQSLNFSLDALRRAKLISAASVKEMTSGVGNREGHYFPRLDHHSKYANSFALNNSSRSMDGLIGGGMTIGRNLGRPKKTKAIRSSQVPQSARYTADEVDAMVDQVQNFQGPLVPCSICQKFVKRERLRSHIHECHLLQGERIICPQCGMGLKSKGSYRVHIWRHKRGVLAIKPHFQQQGS